MDSNGDILDLLSNIATVFAALGSIAAAYIAREAFRFHKRLETKNINFSKQEATLSHLQDLIVSFAEIRVLSKEEWSDDRSDKLRSQTLALKRAMSITGSMHRDLERSLEAWYLEKDDEGFSVDSVVGYNLSQIGAMVGNKYDRFFSARFDELLDIQDELFDELSV